MSLNNFRLKTVFAAVVFFVSVSAFANEEPPKKEEGGGKEQKAESNAKKEDGWQEVSAKVQALKAKADTHQKNIQALVEEKTKTHNEARLSEIVKQLVLEHKMYSDATKEYDRERAYLMYRFPEKGLKGDRSYERMEVKSLEEMESQMSLEGRVKGVLTKVRKQYPTKEVENGVETPEAVAKKKKAIHDDLQKEENSLSSPVILSK